MKATAIANANIALVKYWGKRDKKLMLPNNGSVSMTTSGLNTKTTVEFSKDYDKDELILNGKKLDPDTKQYDEYILSFMNTVRMMAGVDLKAKIVSENNFPTAAGLASSASAFAALAAAVNNALGMKLESRQLSMLARRGSGSATRSVHGGFVHWHRGEKDDGTDSFAEQIAKEDYWPEFRMVVCITSRQEKKVKSRAGMTQTIATSPMYKAWLDTVQDDINTMIEAIKEKNFTLTGKTAEHNCLKMHSTMITTRPMILYWNNVTVEILHSIMQWREDGLESYFTMDAGPQVKILCLEKDVVALAAKLKDIKGIQETIVTQPGSGVRVVEDHLF